MPTKTSPHQTTSSLRFRIGIVAAALGFMSACAGGGFNGVLPGYGDWGIKGIKKEDSVPKQAKAWEWECDGCEYRYAVNEFPTHQFTESDNYADTSQVVVDSESRTLFLHVQGRHKEFDVETDVTSGSAILDNTAPTGITGFNVSPVASLSATAIMSWTHATDNVQLGDYELKVGTSPGGDEVMPYRVIGNVDNYQVTGLSLAYSTLYYSTVRSVDTAGNVGPEVISPSWYVVGGAVFVTGISDEALPLQAKVWNWGCTEPSCDYRFIRNASPTHTFAAEPWVATLTESAAAVSGLQYLHVQARDTLTSEESVVVSVSVMIDVDVPSDPDALTLVTPGTETDTAEFSWTASTDNLAVDHYEVGIGTLSGATNVVAFTNVGNVVQHFFGSMSLSDGVDYYTVVRAVDAAGNVSGEVVSVAWRIPDPPPPSSALTVINATSTTIELGWTVPSVTGIIDYIVQYKLSTDSVWLTYADGVSVETVATVAGLSEATSYDFRVRPYNGTTGPFSNVAIGLTTVDHPFFDPGAYRAMNLGGATDSQVVAHEDGTLVSLNGAPLTTLNAGETFGFLSVVGDVIEANLPLFVAGRLGSGADNMKGNMVWSPPDWAGREFIFTATREAPHIVTVYAFENSNVEIYLGGSLEDSQFVGLDTSYSFSLPLDGGYKLVSDGFIIAFEYSSNGGRVVDPKPLLPASTDLIGFPSRWARLVTWTDANNYNLVYSDSTVTPGVINEGTALEITPHYGEMQRYTGEALRIIANDRVVANSNADGQGWCSSPFLPVAMMRKKYALNVDADWVAFASLEPAVVRVIDPSGGETTVTLTRTGTEPQAPYKARITGVTEGYRFQSDSRFGTWYEPLTDSFGAMRDETILFGVD